MIVISYLLIFFVIFVSLSVAAWVIFTIVIEFFGAPFVPSSKRQLKKVFDKLNFKKGDIAFDLGSGDGSVLRFLSREYGLKGIGIELNPILYYYSLLLNKIFNYKTIYKRGSFYSEDLKKADVIYIFQNPKVLKKLESKIQKECKKGTLIISHGFEFKGFKFMQLGEFKSKSFNTYVYVRRIHKFTS